MIKTVQFYLGKELFAIPIENVLSIEKIGDITNIVRTPNYMRGAIYLRGDLIAVIDLRTLLGKNDVLDNERNRMVIVEMNGRKIGLVVDEVKDISDINEKDIESIEESDILSIVKQEKQLILLLKIEKIVNIEKVSEQLQSLHYRNNEEK